MAQKLEALRGTGRASILGSAVQSSGQRRLGVHNFGFGVPMGNPHLGNIQYGKIWETVGKIWKNDGYILYIYIIYIHITWIQHGILMHLGDCQYFEMNPQ
jgi:hypothetical protein